MKKLLKLATLTIILLILTSWTNIMFAYAVDYSLDVSVSGSGSTSPSGSGSYAEGTSVDVSASAASGWSFSHWMLDSSDAGSANPISVTMNGDHGLVAVFEEIPPTFYDLEIIISGNGRTDPSDGTHSYEEGTPVIVEATPRAHWSFNHWELDGTNVGSDDTVTVTMNDNHVLTAVFTSDPPTTYTLSVSVSGSGSTSPSGSGSYAEGTNVDVSASVDSGWSFSHWMLDSSDAGSANPISITMNDNHALTAVFEEIPPTYYDLEISVSGSGSTSPSGGVHSYAEGNEVSVSASANPGWSFSHWELDDNNVGSANSITVTMNDNHVLTAVFTLIPPTTHTLYISISGSGNTNPSGTSSYVEGTQVVVSASPSSGWNFSYWELDSSIVGSDDSITVTMNGDHSLVAVFEEAPPTTLDVSVSGSGSTSPSGSASYAEGTAVQVSASADSGWSFSHWELDSSNAGSTNPITVTMETNHTLIAVFIDLPKFDLEITVSGYGSTSPSNGVHSYEEGSEVSVSVSANLGWSFSHWELDTENVGSINPITVTMNTSHILTAVFTQLKCTLTVYSDYGNPTPSVGVHTYNVGDQIDLSINSGIWIENNFCICTGWTGTGSIQSINKATDSTFTITQDSIITWNWEIVQKATNPIITSTIDVNQGLVTVTIISPDDIQVTIYYTDDQTNPTTSSNVYTSPLIYNHDVTIKAIAYVPGLEPSDIVLKIITLDSSTNQLDTPLPPELITPINGAVIDNTTVTFSWNLSQGATDYQIEITGPTSKLETITTTSYSTTLTSGTYTWRINARNTNGTQWSEIRTFTVELPQPDDNGIINNLELHVDKPIIGNQETTSVTVSFDIKNPQQSVIQLILALKENLTSSSEELLDTQIELFVSMGDKKYTYSFDVKGSDLGTGTHNIFAELTITISQTTSHDGTFSKKSEESSITVSEKSLVNTSQNSSPFNELSILLIVTAAVTIIGAAYFLIRKGGHVLSF